MKLYSEDSSPFSAPVRIAIYAKGLNIEIEPPPGGLLSAQFHAINAVGTIPCLILEDGTPLPESAAILEYLEDKFPDPPLRPAGPEAKALVRLLQRIGELHIMTPLVELFRQADPSNRDASAAIWLTRLVRGLSSLQIYVGEDNFAVGPSLTLADCALTPALFMLPKITAAYGKPALLEAYPPIGRYIASSGRHPAIVRVLGQMAPAWSRTVTAAG
ncbi:glutathione S-transferase family protein [Methylocapsa palsarum]|uniref:Maleylpyruvate isomerase n=1 Tax=Methylocapsa palsarum TaxID=1612308 RepID=A0A1I4AZG6_9HYPH|nr:glutathione S-transferase family protein [Methylocapsa palsarum]SFK62032.1 maleylpyruvate isomerase [Methylocapsa palsarum]